METNEDINIVFSSDDNYSKYTGVAICSIFENKTTEKNINIFILDGGIKETNKEKLINISKKYNFYLEFKKVSNEEINKLKIRDHLTHSTYYRLLIPEIITNIDKCLYLDCDILIIDDLENLYSTNIENALLAACDEREHFRGDYEKLGIPEKNKYFNAGVLLINLKKWREESLSKKLINHALKNSYKFDMHDQDILNSLLYNKWIEISPKYNYISNFAEQKLLKKSQISIIHYTGLKPWNYICLNPLKKEYFNYLKLTPWKDEIFYIDKNYKKFLIKIFKYLSILLLPQKVLQKIRKIRYINHLKKLKK